MLYESYQCRRAFISNVYIPIIILFLFLVYCVFLFWIFYKESPSYIQRCPSHAKCTSEITHRHVATSCIFRTEHRSLITLYDTSKTKISRFFCMYRKRINSHSRADKLPHPRKIVVDLTSRFKKNGVRREIHASRDPSCAIRHRDVTLQWRLYAPYRRRTARTNLYSSHDADLKGDDIAKVTCQRTNAFIRLTGIDTRRRENVRRSVVAIRSTNLMSISSG